MFNFNLQQRAFEELSAEQFRVVYFLNNTLSMVNESNKTPDNNKIEMFNGYMMDKLGLSERQVQRLIKRLEQLDFIIVERATRKNQPNVITINCDIMCDKNVTLNKNINKNKKYKTSKDFSTMSGNVMSEEENKNYKTKIINMKNEMSENVMSNVDNIIQSDDVNNINSDELSNSVGCVVVRLNDKENERSDNGTTAMNAKEAKENESSGCDKENKMIISTFGKKENDKPIEEKESTNLNAAAPTREEITLMKQTMWQTKDKKSYENFKVYEDRFIEMMRQYKAANPSDTAFVDTMRNWYKNSKQYFPKDNIPNTDMDILNYHIESMCIADTADKLETAIRKIDSWFNRLAKYSKQVEELTEKVNKIMENEATRNKTVWKEWADKLTKAS